MQFNDKIKRFLLIIIISFIYMVVSILLGTVSYPGEDDTFLNLIAAGAFGHKESTHLIFSSTVWGWILNILYSIFPRINCYFWSLVLLNLLSLTGVIYVITSRMNIRLTMGITTMTNVLCAYDFYNAIQFTKSAALYTVAGGCLIWYSNRHRSRWWIGGIALFFLGAMIRIQSMVMVVPFLLTLLICGWHKSENSWKWWGRCIGSIMALILISVIIDRISYSDDAWKEYNEFTNTRGIIHDHSGISYDDHVEEYLKAGISKEDASLFMMWLYGDMDYYTTDFVERIIDIEDARERIALRLTFDAVEGTFRNIITAIRAQWIPKLFVALLLLVLLMCGQRERACVITSAFILMGFYWYFTCIGRVLWRVEVGCWMAGITCVLTLVLSDIKTSVLFGRRETNKMVIIGTLIICVVFMTGMTHNFIRNKDRKIIADRGSITGLMERLNRDEEFFYCSANFFVTNNPMEISRTRYGDIFRNHCYLGTWIIPSPAGLYYAEKREIHNPMKALIDRRDVRLLCNNHDTTELIRRHLAQTYQVEIVAKEVEEGIWDFEVYEE